MSFLSVFNNRQTGFRMSITVRAFFKAEPTVAFYCQYQRRSLAGLADKHTAYLTLWYYGIPNIKLFWFTNESYIRLLYKIILLKSAIYRLKWSQASSRTTEEHASSNYHKTSKRSRGHFFHRSICGAYSWDLAGWQNNWSNKLEKQEKCYRNQMNCGNDVKKVSRSRS